MFEGLADLRRHAGAGLAVNTPTGFLIHADLLRVAHLVRRPRMRRRSRSQAMCDCPRLVGAED